MQISITNSFKKAAKKLTLHQKEIVETAIVDIEKNPEIGELKKGDLANVRVYKFHLHHQLMLLAYLYLENDAEREIVLLSLSSHQNFYRDLKKSIKS